MELPRRTLVGVALGAGVVAAGCSTDDPPRSSPPAAPTRPGPGRQPGVATPVPRQRYLELRVLDVAAGEDLQALLVDLGETVRTLPDVDALTVTVGVGPAAVRASRGDDSIGAADLPAFASDAFEGDTGGDVMLQVCADRKPSAEAAAATLLERFERRLAPRWQMTGYRGQVDGVAARNVLGFYDGIAGPKTTDDIDAAVWTDESDGIADATLCVVRRIRLDHRRFGLLPAAEQEATIGRTKKSGAPLSGGDIETDVDLQAKSDSGVFDIPNDAHVRRAHPLFSGAGKLMLRRGYSYRAAPDDQGLAFICFQRSLDMFVRTQNSMDGGDRLLDFATTTGSAAFLVLPGHDAEHPLGAPLFA